MKRTTLALLALAALLAPAPAAARPRWCAQLWGINHAKRLARETYRGERHVSRRDFDRLYNAESCLRNGRARPYVAWYAHHQRSLWRQRRRASQLSYATASWYDDSGATASGWHARYGVAVCGSGGGPCVPFGTRILFAYHGRSVVATADDHGPYVSGRAFDLGGSTASALGFSGVDTVGYRIQ